MGSYVIFATHPSNPPTPVAATVCPAGWEQVGEPGADIGGCGLQSCGERYWSNNPAECADACAARSDCLGFNWAPMGGDRNHEAMTVCTLYNSDTPTSSWWGSAGHVQIFCKPEAYTMVDGCLNQNTEVPRAVVTATSGATASVRCCTLEGDRCDTDHLEGGCQSDKTYEE